MEQEMYKCRHCAYLMDWSSNLRKHERAMHKEDASKEIYINSTLSSTNHDIYDVRLKENFKFLSLDLQDVVKMFLYPTF